MKIRKFKIGYHYLANYGVQDRIQTERWKVPIFDLENTVNKLIQFINGDNIISFLSSLKAECFFSECLRTYDDIVFNTMSCGIGQKETIIYAEHYTASILEVLMVHYPQSFGELYELASGKLEFKKALLDFSEIDLTNADLSMIDFSVAKFVKANLIQTKGITLEALNLCESYDFAKLPAEITPIWSTTKAEKVLHDLAKLKEHGRRLLLSKDKSAKSKGELIVNHAQNLITEISITPKHDKLFQDKFLQILHQHDRLLNHPRDHAIKKIISNIALFILGAGVFYAAAVGAHYFATGRILFFSRTKSKELIDTVENDMVQVCAARV